MNTPLLSILVVEDDKAIAAFLHTALEREGFTATIVNDGRLALTHINQSPPDLVLLDLMLPGMDGLQLCQAIRRRSDYIPIIMVTAKDEDVDKIVGLELGADDYTAKPFKNATCWRGCGRRCDWRKAGAKRRNPVFLNLIDNAVKYAPGSTVAIQFIPQNQAVRVEVRDTGPGIAADDLSRIFEPFHRGQRDDDMPGTGLGLTIVKSILDQRNAPIRVDSQPDKGTRFVFSLPVTN
ncbi:MAG: response regulator [Chloroflexi bacterium]|nr:response regulator [Chloroflexota bacterium]